MDKRFYCAKLPDGGELSLEGPEAHHLMKVMRLPVGECVELFDGVGNVVAADILALGKRDVTLAVADRRWFPPPVAPLTLAVAVPKGDRFDWLVEKATELGVARLIPLRTSRGVVDPRETKLERLRNVIVEACKQSRRPWLMELSTPQDFSSLFSLGGGCLVADPSGDSLPAMMAKEKAATTIAVGPEGGWTADEIEKARAAGAAIVSLGDSLLRIETAAIALASWWRLSV